MKRRPGLFQSWSGNGFRFVSLAYCAPDQILSGIGSYKTGARWNAIGSFRASYASLTKQTAVSESDAHAKYYGFAREQLRPRLLVAVEFRLDRVLDLTQAQSRSALEITVRGIEREDWRKRQDAGCESRCQALGRAAFSAGAEAMLVPSTRVKGGVNIVFFPENLLAGSLVRICGGEELKFLKM